MLVHPFFGGLEEDDQMFLYICPENGGLEDRRLRPPPEDFKRLACGKMLIFFAAGDNLRGAGQLYYEDLKKSEWGGSVDVVEHGEGHVFHLFNSDCENAADLVKRFGSFINQK